jgi:hypothetical protein
MIINKSCAFQLPFSGQILKKYFCVQKNRQYRKKIAICSGLPREVTKVMLHPSRVFRKNGPSGEEPLWISRRKSVCQDDLENIFDRLNAVLNVLATATEQLS